MKTTIVSILVVLALLASAGAHAETLLLNWSFGNQICKNDVTIGSSGSVSHLKTCYHAVPPVANIPEAALTATQLSALQAAITNAQAGPYMAATPEETLGSASGKLVVMNSAGAPIVIGEFTRTGTLSGTAKINTSQGAKRIVGFMSSHFGLALPTLKP